MQHNILTFITSSGKVVTDRARTVLSEVPVDSPLERVIRSLIERHLESTDVVDIEEDITSFKRLIEVFLREGIENGAKDCLSRDKNGYRVLTIRGYIPPTIEIYRETTSYTPASFRPEGYPGTEKWFDRMEGLGK